MKRDRLNRLLEKFFSTSVTEAEYNELRNGTEEASDDMLSEGLEHAWSRSDFSNTMPEAAKYRVKSSIDRSIRRDAWRGTAAKIYRVAAAVMIPLLLASTIYLLVDRNNTQNRQADLLDVYVARGEKATIKLPDGSTVMLNSKSRLRYPSDFSSKERWIMLDGEAFFKVSKRHGQSFTVKTDKMNVRVLGTEFNVSAYSSETVASVVLVHGSVAVGAPNSEPTIIAPNQMFSINTKTGMGKVQEVNVFNHTCWRQGILNLDSEPLVTALDKLSRQFNVDFEFDRSRLGNDRITGKLDLNEGVEAALNSIALASPIKFKKHKNKIVITPM